MTQLDWKTVVEIQELESDLHRQLHTPLDKAEKAKLKKRAQKYATLVKDPKVMKTLVLCYGDSPDDRVGIVESKKRFGKAVMDKLKR